MNAFTAARIAVVVVASLMGFASCGPYVVGSGKIVEETREVSTFDRIHVGSAVHATVSVGQVAPLKITGDDNVLELFKTQVRDGILVIETDSLASYSTKNAVTVTVGTAALTSASASGGSSVVVNEMTGDSVALDMTGASSVEVGKIVATAEVKVSGSGGSTLKASGSSPSLEANLSGASTLDAPGLSTRSARVALSGGSRADFGATTEVTGSLSGSSTLSVGGGANVEGVDTSGGSTVVAR